MSSVLKYLYLQLEPTHLMNQHISCIIQLIISTKIPGIFDGRNTFYGMGIICSVIRAVSSFFTIPHSEDVSTEDIIRIAEIERKNLPSSRRPLRLNLIEFNKPVIPLAYLDSHMGCQMAFEPLNTLVEWQHANSYQWSPSRLSINIFHAND